MAGMNFIAHYHDEAGEYVRITTTARYVDTVTEAKGYAEANGYPFIEVLVWGQRPSQGTERHRYYVRDPESKDGWRKVKNYEFQRKVSKAKKGEAA